MKIISTEIFDIYVKRQPISLLKHFNKLKNTSSDNVFRFTIAAVYSSMIEGSRLLMSDYMKIKTSGMNTTNKDYQQINDLIKAYDFAAMSDLNKENLMQSHNIATKNLISTGKYRGQIRDKEVGIYDSNGQCIYKGCKAKNVASEIEKLFNDIHTLINQKLTYTEIFYFASMIHLVFVKIHPFADGNGRTGRLLEKWFLATKLGATAWQIQNEKLYQKRLKSYYNFLDIGFEYEIINYSASLPFIKMLPMALRIK